MKVNKIFKANRHMKAEISDKTIKPNTIKPNTLKPNTMILWLSLMLLFVVIVPINAFASDYKVEVKPIYSTISPTEQARFDLTITNNGNKDARYRIFYSDVMWDFATDPRTDSTVTIGPQQSKTVHLVLSPLNLALATYVIPVTINPETDNDYTIVNLQVSIMSDEQKNGNVYGTAIETTIKIDPSIDPRKDVSITVNVANMNPKDNPNITFVLESGLFTDQRQISLGPYEKKEFVVTKKLDPLEKPDKYFLDAYFTIYQNNRSAIIGRIPKSIVFEIIDYGKIEKNDSVTKKFLYSNETITLWNSGNDNRSELLKIEASVLKSIFQKISPKPDQMITEQDKRYYGFEVTLKPRESKQIMIITDYTILIYLAIIIIILAVFYIIFRSPIAIKKSYTHLTMKEGGISEMKVIIHVKNRSYKTRENIIVTDRLSNIAEVLKDFPVGTLQPSSILKHDKHGVVIKWEIDSLDGFEERILTYNIKSRLSILGEFRLPRAKATFTQFRRKRTVSSNRVVSRG